MSMIGLKAPYWSGAAFDKSGVERKAAKQAFFVRWKLGHPIPLGTMQLAHVSGRFLALKPTSPTAHHTWRLSDGLRFQSESLAWVVVLDDLGWPLGMIT